MRRRFSLSRFLKGLLVLSLLNAHVGWAVSPRVEFSLPDGGTECLWGLRISAGSGKSLTLLADLCSPMPISAPESLAWRDLDAYATATGVKMGEKHATLSGLGFEFSAFYPDDAPVEMAATLRGAPRTTLFHLFLPAGSADSNANGVAASILDARVLIEGPLALHPETPRVQINQLLQVDGLLSGVELDVLHNKGSLLLSNVSGTVGTFINENKGRIGQWSSSMARLENSGHLLLEKGQYEVGDLTNTGTLVLGADPDATASETGTWTGMGAWTLLQGTNPALDAALVPDLATCMATLTVNGVILHRPLPDCETFRKAESNEFLLSLLTEKSLRTLCAAEGLTPATSYLKTPTLRGVFTVQSDVTLEEKLSSYPFLRLSGQKSLSFTDVSQNPFSLNELENLPFASVCAFVNGPVTLLKAMTIPDLTVVSSHPTCLSLLHPLSANNLALSLSCLSVGSPQSLTSLSAAKLFLHAFSAQGIDMRYGKVSIGPQGGVLLTQGPFHLGKLVSQGVNPHGILAHQSINDSCGRRNKASVWAFHRNHPSPSSGLFGSLSEFTEIPFKETGWEIFQGNGAGLYAAGPLFIASSDWNQEGSLLFAEKEAVFQVNGKVNILSGHIESGQSILFAGGTHFFLGRPLPTRVYTSRSTGCCQSTYSYEDRQSSPKSLIYGKETVHIDFPHITVFGSEILSLQSPILRQGAILQETPYILWKGSLTAHHTGWSGRAPVCERTQLAYEPAVIFTRGDFTLQGNAAVFNGMVDAGGRVDISLAGSGIFANQQRVRPSLGGQTLEIDLTKAAEALIKSGFWKTGAAGQLTPLWGEGPQETPLPPPVFFTPQVKGALAGPQPPHAAPFFIYPRSLLESMLERSLAQNLKTLNLGAPTGMTTLDYLLHNAAQLKANLGRDIRFTDVGSLESPLLVYIQNANGGLMPHLLVPPHLVNQADVRGETVAIRAEGDLTFISNVLQAENKLDVCAAHSIVRERAPAYATSSSNGDTRILTQNAMPPQVFYSNGEMTVIAKDSYSSTASYTKAIHGARIGAMSGNSVSKPEILTQKSVTKNEGKKGTWRKHYVDETINIWHTIYPDVVEVGEHLDSRAGVIIFLEASQFSANSLTYTAPKLEITPTVAVNKNSVTVDESGPFSDRAYRAFQESLSVARATLTATQDIIFNVTNATLSGVTLAANNIYNYAKNFTISVAKQEVKYGESSEKTNLLGASGSEEEGGQETAVLSKVFADRWINVGEGEMTWISVHGMIREMMLNEKDFIQGTEVLKSWMKSESWRAGLRAPAVDGGSKGGISDPLISSAQNMGDAANSPNGVQDEVAAVAKFANQLLSDARIAYAFWTDSKMRMGDKWESPWKALAARYATLAFSYEHRRSSSSQHRPVPGNLAVGLMVADNDVIALAGNNTIEKAVLTTQSFTSTGATGSSEAKSSTEHGSVSYNFITGNVGVSGGYSTSHQSQVQNIISRTRIDDLYLRTKDVVISGAQIIGRLVDVIATGHVSIKSVLDTFQMCQSQASFSISLDGSLPDVTLGDKSTSEAVVRDIAGLVGTEKFLLTVGGQLSLLSADVGLRPDGVLVKSVTGDHLHETYDGEQSIAVEGETILEQLHEFSDEDGFYLNAWAGTAQSIVNNIQAFQAEMKAADLKAQQAKAAAQPQDGAHDPSKDRKSADQNMEMNKAVMAKFEADIEALVEKWVDDLLGNRQEKPKSQTSPAPKAEHILKKQTPASPKKPSTSPAAQKLLSWQGAYELGIESVDSPWDLFLGPVRMAKAAIFGTQWLKNKITSALAKSLSKRHVKDAPSMAERVVERAGQQAHRQEWQVPQAARDKIPEFLKNTERQADKGGGTKWLDEKGHYIRIDKGDPKSSYPSGQRDHVHIQSGGKVIGRDGKPIDPKAVDNPASHPDAHIPLNEWLNWRHWNKP